MLACLLLLHITAYDNINVSADGALTSPWTDLAASEFPTWPIACAQITASKLIPTAVDMGPWAYPWQAKRMWLYMIGRLPFHYAATVRVANDGHS